MSLYSDYLINKNNSMENWFQIFIENRQGKKKKTGKEWSGGGIIHCHSSNVTSPFYIQKLRIQKWVRHTSWFHRAHNLQET